MVSQIKRIILTDRHTNIQTDRQMNKRTERQTDRRTNGVTYKLTARWTDINRETVAETQAYKALNT